MDGAFVKKPSHGYFMLVKNQYDWIRIVDVTQFSNLESVSYFMIQTLFLFTWEYGIHFWKLRLCQMKLHNYLHFSIKIAVMNISFQLENIDGDCDLKKYKRKSLARQCCHLMIINQFSDCQKLRIVRCQNFTTRVKMIL